MAFNNNLGIISENAKLVFSECHAFYMKLFVISCLDNTTLLMLSQ